MDQYDEEVPVLIVGSSMVGMSLSVFLASQGIKTLACEKHASTAIHPRAAFFISRTIEIYRSFDLMQTMLTESEKAYDSHAGIVGVESLAGKKIASYLEDMNADIGAVTPGLRVFLTQSMFEPLLRAKCSELGAELRFSSEIIDVKQDAERCITTVKDVQSGETKRIKSKYVVACDGSKSPARRKLGINLIGYGEMSRSITIYFKADVLKYVDQKYNGVIYVNNKTLRGFYRIDKDGQSGFLVVFTAGEQGTEKSRYPADGITDGKAKELLLAAIGEDIDCTIDLVMPWSASSEYAERYRDGRIFLAGDAAHVVPPTGGFGGNCGIHDAHNLAWKLALVLKGKANPDLLDTYEQERLPMGRFTVDQAYARYVNRSAPELRDHRVHDEVDDFTFELGQRYNESQGFEYGVQPPGHHHETPLEPTSAAGARAPHLWLDCNGNKSIHDMLAIDGYTLLVPKSYHHMYWLDAGNSLKKEFPLKTVVVSHPQFCSLYKITHSGCVLVRPDAYIAWKAAGIPLETESETETCKNKLRGVLRRILFLDPPVAPPKKAMVNGVPAPQQKSMVNGVSEISGQQLLDYLKEYISKHENNEDLGAELEELRTENEGLKKELESLRKESQVWKQMRNLLVGE